MRLHVGWAINRIPYCSSDGCAWLGVGYGVGWLAVGLKNRRRLILDDRYIAVRICVQVDRARVILIMRACLGS